MRLKIKLLSIFILLSSGDVFSQSNNFFFISPGVDCGYRSVLGSRGSFFVNIRPEKHFDLFLGTAITKFSGFGYGVGMRIYPVAKKKLFPFIGFAFDNFYRGHNFYINEKETKQHYDPNESSNYYSEPNKFYIPFIGVRKDFSIIADPPNEDKSIDFSLGLTFSYRQADIDQEVIFTGGLKNSDYESKINKDLASCYGASLSFIYYFHY